MESSIILGKTKIYQNSSPYIIAEIGVNHEGDINQAKKLIDLAKEGGANAAKFQTYKANTIASKNSPSYWDTSKESTKSQYELFLKYDSFGEREYYSLYEHCKSNEIDFISTPFDHFSVDFLDEILPFYKISSSDITNIPLLEYISSKKKPIVLSTGASSINEINLALTKMEEAGANNIALLHCILNYPTSYENANLEMIKHMKNTYEERIIGYSDHTLPDSSMSVLSAAFLLGAVIIEKHFTHDKTLPGNDHYHAMDINDLKIFKERLKFLQTIKGNYSNKTDIPSEQISRKNARRSLVINKDLSAGVILKKSDLICKRPGNGISPIDIDKVVGCKINKKLKNDDILNWNDLN